MGQPQITSPEALMISALLATGRFVPSEYNLTDEDLSCYEKLWRFSAEYQARAGNAPGLELIKSRFPDFTFLPGIDAGWAADQLHEASRGREVRRGLRDVMGFLGEGDYEAMDEAIAKLALPRRAIAVTGMNALDVASIEHGVVKVGLPLPFKPLQDTVQCIGYEELWTLGSYTGHGKSQMLPYYAAHIAEAGYHVGYISLEMPARAINRRVLRCHARGDRSMQARLANAELSVRREALEELAAKIPGKIETIDPSMGKLHIETIADFMAGKHIVMIDHVGLLQMPDGARAIDDWRIMAKISNRLREFNLSTKVAMLNAAQTNKEPTGMKPPLLSDIAQSIAISQDSDVVLTQSHPAKGLLAHAVRKAREAETVTWYTRFDPAHADYREITFEEAKNFKLTDEDRQHDSA